MTVHFSRLETTRSSRPITTMLQFSNSTRTTFPDAQNDFNFAAPIPAAMPLPGNNPIFAPDAVFGQAPVFNQARNPVVNQFFNPALPNLELDPTFQPGYPFIPNPELAPGFVPVAPVLHLQLPPAFNFDPTLAFNFQPAPGLAPAPGFPPAPVNEPAAHVASPHLQEPVSAQFPAAIQPPALNQEPAQRPTCPWNSRSSPSRCSPNAEEKETHAGRG